MRQTRFLAFMAGLLIFVSAAAHGQKARPATEADFTGYWRIVLIPNEVHKSPFKNERMGFADPCQFLVHRPDGTWFNLSLTNMAGAEESRRQCPTKRAGVDVAMSVQAPSTFRWSKLSAQDGLFIIKNTAPQTDPNKPVALVWKADYALEDIPGSELKKGDLLMQVVRNVGGNNLEPVWPMILRPVEP